MKNYTAKRICTNGIIFGLMEKMIPLITPSTYSKIADNNSGD